MKTVNPDKRIFMILYAVGFGGACLIGLLSTSFFAYEAFNMLWADIIYLLLVALLYITAFVQETLTSRVRRRIVANAFIFLGNLVFFILVYFISDICVFLALLYSFATALLVAGVGIRDMRVNMKHIVGAPSMLLVAMVKLMSVDFVNDIYFAWALIPASVLTIVFSIAAYFLLGALLPSRKPARVGYTFACVFVIFWVSFSYSFTGIGVVDRAFDDSEPERRECIVLDTDIDSGANTVTKFKVKVEFDGEERWITVAVTDYHTIEKEDVIVINYYKGALGFAYLEYGGPLEKDDET